ncbi:hypothetical protein HY637_05990 [Candidatus Woesearchaeota archaeon]|nr:hypothetical protein [Candidatus Woesearchaeota archaeon]
MAAKTKDNRLKNIITLIGSLILIILFMRHKAQHTEFIFDITASILIVAVFYKFYNKLHQDYISFFFLILTLIVHNMGLYAATPLGIRFDHYMHFLGGFSLALIGDRMFCERFGKPKRFFLLMIFALGIGAIGEVLEWVGYGVLGEGDGFFFYGIGDEGEWRNSMLDLAFNFFGAVILSSIMVFRNKQ